MPGHRTQLTGKSATAPLTFFADFDGGSKLWHHSSPNKALLLS